METRLLPPQDRLHQLALHARRGQTGYGAVAAGLGHAGSVGGGFWLVWRGGVGGGAWRGALGGGGVGAAVFGAGEVVGGWGLGEGGGVAGFVGWDMWGYGVGWEQCVHWDINLWECCDGI